MALAYLDNAPDPYLAFVDPERPAIDAARAGDTDAFDALYRRYEPTIYAFTYRIMGDVDDAHDMTQIAFVKALAAIGRTNDALNFSAWIHSIANNTCIELLRHRQRYHRTSWDPVRHDHLFLAGKYEKPDEAVECVETERAVQVALRKMSRRHRTALVLREFEGLSCEEIGARIGLSRSAVKSMLFRAREEFRHVWAAMGEDAPPRRPRGTHRPLRRSRLLAKPWTAEEYATVAAMTDAGANLEAISDRLNRTIWAVKHKVLKLRAQRKAVAS